MCLPKRGQGLTPCDGNSSVASCPLYEQELTDASVMRYNTYREVC